MKQIVFPVLLKVHAILAIFQNYLLLFLTPRKGAALALSRIHHGKLVEARLHAKIIADVKPVTPPRSHTPPPLLSHIPPPFCTGTPADAFSS